MAEGERATGTPNTIYDLSSVLFHALEGGASYDTYIRDAEEAGDEELANFFRRVRDEDSTRADEAQRLLAGRTSTAAGRTGGAADVPAEGMVAGASPRTEPISTPPGEGDVPPRRTEETPSPRPEPSSDFPGTEPIREDVATARTGETPPPPEEVPPERTGEIPTAEELPPPRAEEVPMAEEVPSGVPAQAPPGDVTPPVGRGNVRREASSRTEEEGAGQEEEREEDKGLVDRARDYLLGEGRERDYLRGEDRER